MINALVLQRRLLALGSWLSALEAQRMLKFTAFFSVNSVAQVSYRPRRKRMAVLVSKMDHCLFDLLIRQRSGELHCDIPVVISNHPDLGHVARMFEVDYEHLGFKRDLDKAVAKQQQESAIEKVCASVVMVVDKG
jgi:formyltetrahydrofolate hydrolase